ncbi:isopentenyl diphosphate isomerase/L-lactate dehydrogenase-like FMN-dependent dehydrogenase/rubredoxin [Methanohalophilus levihalophilus]|uniref:alpha-hydroxy-acid oxidizing protein n=1 Tax=Methanohalophilus levihalophilus TaxID=1431282 RepID=UPI001AE1FFAA|nr:alpha-hydroxy-acid oxidizing protein [Methanohalophilus levihalophilus]MBP2029099.1 isopentenyl diphosphate isomerase/L-lactate dehydrogenase-like FMN-dependent dehydrogenase/rubredoxin [Methanohalophilus levihalophilus]
MTRWYCTVCNIYHYDDRTGDPETGIEAGTLPDDFPDDWKCPVCGATKDKLRPVDETRDQAEASRNDKKVTVTIAADNPLVRPELVQEYGKPLGLAGIGSGSSYLNNFKALEKIKLRTRLISEHNEPFTKADFFGKEVEIPLFGAPMGGLSYFESIEEEDFIKFILKGCEEAGTIGFTGDTAKEYTEHPGIHALKEYSGNGVNIFKPQSQEVLLDLLKQSEKAGAIAAGIDLDGAGSVNFTLAGKPVYRKTIEDLRELKKSTTLPFMVKGIMCEEDAVAALEAGADIIGISNHGGRVLDANPGVAEVLPGIVNTIRNTKNGKNAVITADGGIRTGFDIMKMLALGADFVLAGRPLVREAVPHGSEGVKRLIDFMKADLKKAMVMTSCNRLEDINEDIIFKM